MHVYEIREEAFPKLVEKFEKMVKRSRKNHLPAPSFEVIHEREEKKTKTIYDAFGDKEVVEYFVNYLYVTVAGERPVVQGWEFVATIDHAEEGNIIKTVPDTGQLPVAYRTAAPLCEHCNSRRRRSETFVVRKAGVWKQLGRNCLADFFPGASPDDLATTAGWWVEADELLASIRDEDGGHCYTAEDRIPIETLLAATEATIRTFGWVAKGRAKDTGERPTSQRVALLFANPVNLSALDKAEVKLIEENYRDEDAEVIEAALEWVRTFDPETAEDYRYNLYLICKGESVRQSNFGLACSLMPAYRRHLGITAEKVEAAKSEHVGEVKKRLVFEKTFLKSISEPYSSQWGVSYRFTFMNEANVLIWWTSSDEGWEAGQYYDIVATIKKHEEFRGHKQTVVTRVAKHKG
jgi:hypothetical protein